MESENKITMSAFFDDDDDMDKALIIQNVLGGPLVLTDIGDVILYSGETYMWDLNPEDERKLKRSVSLRKAIRNNLIRQLNASQYEVELEREELRTIEEERNKEAELSRLDLNDNISLDVDRIDLTREASRNPRGSRKRVAQNISKDPVLYAKMQAQMRVQNPDLSPHEFAEMIEQDPKLLERLAYQAEQGYSPFQGSGRATIAHPDGHGGTSASQVEFGNFARDGHLTGHGTMQNAYAHQGYRDSFRDEGNYDDFAEELDLGGDSPGGGAVRRF